MPSRSFCVHGHFYQPSREDPLTGRIPEEAGSEPYSNWNERVNDRCYRPNAELGNFEKVSFNIGPTLTRWMEAHTSDTLRRIVEADHANLAKHGVGNAMAQPYHHTILPLASRRDKEIQVRWGIADFVHTFGHSPKGMWLPEAAVDLETLSVLAENGISFTILAPWQAQTTELNRNHPYNVQLPGGKQITVFFYNDAISSSISFNPSATVNAEEFIETYLKSRFNNDGSDELVIAASDGELYGHHQPFRDKFLGYLLDGALSQTGIRTSYPALWLEEHAVEHEIEIRENTSWSCFHGVTRWADVCGCTPTALWKKGLREALDALATEVDKAYEETARKWLKDPSSALDDYIHVVIGENDHPQWQSEHVLKSFNEKDALALRRLMQAQFERQRMFTSCGWFFEEFDRIEPGNNLKYAAQAAVLSEAATGKRVGETILPTLTSIPGTIKGNSAGKTFSTLLEQFRSKIQQL
jgi:alpha-amylase/alpha-mannosidase (GH57 family)